MSPEQIELLTKRAAPGEPAVTFEFTPFAPSAAAAITGASGMYQKVLRRRGILTHKGGHARFDAIGLACLLVVRMMSDRGGPKLASKFAVTAGFGVAWHALAYNHAYSGDHERTLTWDPALAPKIESWQAATASLRHRSDWSREEALEELHRAADSEVVTFNAWEQQSVWLRNIIFRLRGFTDVPVPKFAVWTPGGRTAFCNSLDRALAEDERLEADDEAYDPQLYGPVVVLDLARLGWTLLRNMKRLTGATFVTVHIGAK